jgi:tetratricopeptide (TPR) repeat protein
MAAEPEEQLSPADRRRLARAEGYLDLDLPSEAAKELALVSPAGREGFIWNYQSGECHRQLGNWEDGARRFATCVELRKDVLECHVGLGWCLKRAGRIDDAIKALEAGERIIRHRSQTGRALLLYNLACYNALAGRLRLVLRHLGEAIALEPNFLKGIAKERDFDQVREEPAFVELILRAGKRHDDSADNQETG